MRTSAKRIEAKVGGVERWREVEEGEAELCEGTLERVGCGGEDCS